MGGGLMQLVAYGAQDIYLTGNPQITFFKVVYRRHTNFSMEAIEQTWNGTSTADGRCTATISRNGDLVHRMYLEVTADDTATAATANSGSKGITDIELEIGGQKIDKQSGTWMEVWAELTEPNPSGTCATDHTGAATATLFQRMSGMGGVTDGGTVSDLVFFIPLQFWFCRNPGLALPLIALQYHEVKVKITFEDIKELGGCASGAGSYNDGHSELTSVNVISADTKFALWCDYIYLDTDERRRFAQVSHEYLIEQLQYSSLSGKKKYELNLNHPVKELIWSGPRGVGEDGRVINNGDHPFQMFERKKISDAGKFQLKLNGHDRFKARDYKYFTRTQIWEHHTGY